MNALRWVGLLALIACAGGAALILFREQKKPVSVPQKIDPPKVVALPPTERRTNYPSDVPVVSSRPDGPANTRVLMIGNSYSFYNGMPWLLEAFSERDAKPLRVTVVAYPNMSFTEHRRAGVEHFIREQKWDFVVLQEYSLSPLMDAEAFQTDGAALVAEVKAAGAVPILYQTWARESNPASQAVLSGQYAKLAEKSGARVARVGDAWALLRKQAQAPVLFEFDGSHPTLEGSYAAACVLYTAISGRSAKGLPRTVAPAVRKSQTWVMADGAYDLPADTAAAIQAAAEAVAKVEDGTKPAP